MNELIKTIKQTLKATADNIWFMIPVTLLAYVVGIIVTMAIVYTEGTGEDYAHMGTLMALIIAALLNLLATVCVLPADINMALSMGKARKYLVAANYVGWLRNTLVVLLITVAGSVLEECIYSRLYPEAVCEINVRAFLCDPAHFVTILICVPAVMLFGAAFTMRFGNKVIWVFWAVYMLCMFLANRISENPDSLVARVVIKLLEALSKLNNIPIICIGLGVICVVFANLMLRKQMVTY